MLSASSITNAQIRDLRARVMSGSPYAESCDIALGIVELDGADAEVERELARERCAAILNAHAAHSSQGGGHRVS